MMRRMLHLALALGASLPCVFAAQPWKDCRSLERHGKRGEAKACFGRLLRAPDAISRAEGFRGLGQYEEPKVSLRAPIRISRNRLRSEPNGDFSSSIVSMPAKRLLFS